MKGDEIQVGTSTGVLTKNKPATEQMRSLGTQFQTERRETTISPDETTRVTTIMQMKQGKGKGKRKVSAIDDRVPANVPEPTSVDMELN